MGGSYSKEQQLVANLEAAKDIQAFDEFLKYIPLDYHNFDSLPASSGTWTKMMNFMLQNPASTSLSTAGQRLLKTKAFYEAVSADDSMKPLIGFLSNSSVPPLAIKAHLDMLHYILHCHLSPITPGCCDPSPVYQDEFYQNCELETRAKEQFLRLGGCEATAKCVQVYSGSLDKVESQQCCAAALRNLHVSLMDRSVSTSLQMSSKILGLGMQHLALLFRLASCASDIVRKEAATLLSGLLLTSKADGVKLLTDMILQDGHFLWLCFFSVSNAQKSNCDCEAQRELLTFAADANEDVMNTLSRAFPRSMVLKSFQVTLPFKVKYKEFTETAEVADVGQRHFYKYLKNQKKRTNWIDVFASIDKEYPNNEAIAQGRLPDPRLVWEGINKEEFIDYVHGELEDFQVQQKVNPDRKWDCHGFEVTYDSSKKYLEVNGYYVHLLLKLLSAPNVTRDQLMISDQVYPILTDALIQKAVILDDPAWKNACLLTVAKLVHLFDDLMLDRSPLAYLIWLLKTSVNQNAMWTKTVLGFLRVLMKKTKGTMNNNMTRFVHSDGIQTLVALINRIHLKLEEPKVIAGQQNEEDLAQIEEEDDEKVEESNEGGDGKNTVEEGKKVEDTKPAAGGPPPPPRLSTQLKNLPPPPPIPGSAAAAEIIDGGKKADAKVEEKKDEKKNDSKDVSATPAPSAPVSTTDVKLRPRVPKKKVPNNERKHRLESASLSPRRARVLAAKMNRVKLTEYLPQMPTATEMTMECLELIKMLLDGDARLYRVICREEFVLMLVQLLVCKEAKVVNLALSILTDCLEHNLHIIPELASTGCFLFLLYAMRNGCTKDMARFFMLYHTKQALSRSPGESILEPYFPPAFIVTSKLTHNVDAWQRLLDEPVYLPNCVWNKDLRALLIADVTKRTEAFRLALEIKEDTVYEFAPQAKVVYPAVDEELYVGNTYVRIFNEQPEAKIPDPAFFLDALVTAITEERYKDEHLTEIVVATATELMSQPNHAAGLDFRGMSALLGEMKKCALAIGKTGKTIGFYTKHFVSCIRLLRTVLAFGMGTNRKMCIEKDGIAILSESLNLLFTSDAFDTAAATEGRPAAVVRAAKTDLLDQTLNCLNSLYTYYLDSNHNNLVAHKDAPVVQPLLAAPEILSVFLKQFAIHLNYAGKEEQDKRLTCTILRVLTSLVSLSPSITTSMLIQGTILDAFYFAFDVPALKEAEKTKSAVDATGDAVEESKEVPSMQRLETVAGAETNYIAPKKMATLNKEKQRRLSTLHKGENDEDLCRAGTQFLRHVLLKAWSAKDVELNMALAEDEKGFACFTTVSTLATYQRLQRAILTVYKMFLSPALMYKLHEKADVFASTVKADTETPVLIWNQTTRDEVRAYIEGEAAGKARKWKHGEVALAKPDSFFPFVLSPVSKELIIYDVYMRVYLAMDKFELPAQYQLPQLTLGLINYMIALCIKDNRFLGLRGGATIAEDIEIISKSYAKLVSTKSYQACVTTPVLNKLTYLCQLLYASKPAIRQSVLYVMSEMVKDKETIGIVEKMMREIHAVLLVDRKSKADEPNIEVTLSIINNLIQKNDKIASDYLDEGLLLTLFEIIFNGGKNSNEKAMADPTFNIEALYTPAQRVAAVTVLGSMLSCQRSSDVRNVSLKLLSEFFRMNLEYVTGKAVKESVAKEFLSKIDADERTPEFFWTQETRNDLVDFINREMQLLRQHNFKYLDMGASEVNSAISSSLAGSQAPPPPPDAASASVSEVDSKLSNFKKTREDADTIKLKIMFAPFTWMPMAVATRFKPTTLNDQLCVEGVFLESLNKFKKHRLGDKINVFFPKLLQLTTTETAQFSTLVYKEAANVPKDKHDDMDGKEPPAAGPEVQRAIKRLLTCFDCIYSQIDILPYLCQNLIQQQTLDSIGLTLQITISSELHEKVVAVLKKASEQETTAVAMSKMQMIKFLLPLLVRDVNSKNTKLPMDVMATIESLIKYSSYAVQQIYQLGGALVLLKPIFDYDKLVSDGKVKKDDDSPAKTVAIKAAHIIGIMGNDAKHGMEAQLRFDQVLTFKFRKDNIFSMEGDGFMEEFHEDHTSHDRTWDAKQRQKVRRFIDEQLVDLSVLMHDWTKDDLFNVQLLTKVWPDWVDWKAKEDAERESNKREQAKAEAEALLKKSSVAAPVSK